MPTRDFATDHTIPAEVFGDLAAFVVEQHTESMQLGFAVLRIQTSSRQTDDGKRGTWHASLAVGTNVLAQTQYEWCSPAEARARAIAWARESMRGVAAATEPVEPEVVEDDAAVREDIAALTER